MAGATRKPAANGSCGNWENTYGNRLRGGSLQTREDRAILPGFGLGSSAAGKFAAGTISRFREKLKKVDLLILDEVGYVPFSQTGAELLFNVIADCYERQSVIVTSNLEFGQWTSIFGDTKLTSALVDRLVHHAHILSFTGESFRFKQAMERVPL